MNVIFSPIIHQIYAPNFLLSSYLLNCFEMIELMDRVVEYIKLSTDRQQPPGLVPVTKLLLPNLQGIWTFVPRLQILIWVWIFRMGGWNVCW